MSLRGVKFSAVEVAGLSTRPPNRVRQDGILNAGDRQGEGEGDDQLEGGDARRGGGRRDEGGSGKMERGGKKGEIGRG